MIFALAMLVQDRIGTGVGMRFQEVDDGIKILTVREGSPAEKAGFKKDDVVIGVNGKSKPHEQEFVMGIWMANKKPATLTADISASTARTTSRTRPASGRSTSSSRAISATRCSRRASRQSASTSVTTGTFPKARGCSA